VVTARSRTLLVVLLTAVVAVRVSVSQPLSAAAARVAHDPEGTLRHAVDGWTVAGTLGGASAQGVRDVPLAIFYLLGTELGLSAEVLQTAWRILVLVVGVLGSIVLARSVTTEDSTGRSAVEPWTPWVAAVLYGVGVVLVPTLVRSPLEGLAAAALPWAVAPLLSQRRLTWPRAAGAGAWLGLAGVGGPYWAGAAVLAALLAAGLRFRRDPVPVLRWLGFAVLASAWWVATTAWELAYARDVSSLRADVTVRGAIEDFFGGSPFPYYALLVAALGPFLVSAALVVVRPARARIAYVGGLLVAAVAVAMAWLVGLWTPVVFAPVGQDAPASIVGPALALPALGAVVAWTPLLTEIGPRVQGSWAARTLPSGARDALALIAAAGVVVVAVGGLAVAAVEPTPPSDDEPTLARRVAAWSEDAPAGRVLVVPAREDAPTSSIGAALGARPWVARNSLPTSGSTATVALDDVLDRLGHGDGGPGTFSALHRLGISYVLVQLGGPTLEDRANPTALIRSALAIGGASRTAVLTGADATEAGPLVDYGVRSETPQVEVWSIPDGGALRAYREVPMTVVGDAGSVSDLAAAGFLGGRAVRLTADGGDGPVVLSDSARRRDVDQRLPVHPYGPLLDEQAPRVVVPPGAAPVTTATRRVEGVDAVSASSSASDVDGTERRAGTDALAAVDGNPFTAWQSRSGTGVGEWLQIGFGRPVDLAEATVQFVRNPFEGNAVTNVRLTTDSGGRDYTVPADGLLAIGDAGLSESLRIAITGVNGESGAGDSVGISEVTVPGVQVSDATVVSGPASDVWVLAARPGSQTQCVPAVPRGPEPDPGELSTVCARSLSVPGPDSPTLDRVLVSDRSSSVAGQAWVRATDTTQSAAVADDLARPSVVATSSSVAVQDLTARAQAAADDDESTAWRPAPDDRYPTLTLAWDEPAEVSGVQLTLPEGDEASVPTRVRITPEPGAEPGGTSSPTFTDADVGEDGIASFPSVRTRQLTITFLESSGLSTMDSFTGGVAAVPIAVSEVRLVGGPTVTYDADRTRALRCGSGPDVTIDGKVVSTRISTSAREVVSGLPVLARLCSSAPVSSGETELRVDASFRWLPLGLVLWRIGAALDPPSAEEAAGSGAALPGLLSGTGHEQVTLGDDDVDRTLVLSVPAGTGWHADSAEGALPSVIVDGWAQGWVVPAGTTELTLDYSPADVLGPSVATGAVAWGLVLLAALAGSALPLARSAVRSR
jgi:arabinofuranan 3-O-arabinosyltransferase